MVFEPKSFAVADLNAEEHTDHDNREIDGDGRPNLGRDVPDNATKEHEPSQMMPGDEKPPNEIIQPPRAALQFKVAKRRSRRKQLRPESPRSTAAGVR